jgi:hypothetical protein
VSIRRSRKRSAIARRVARPAARHGGKRCLRPAWSETDPADFGLVPLPACHQCERDLDDLPDAQWFRFRLLLLCSTCADDFGGMAVPIRDVERWPDVEDLAGDVEDVRASANRGLDEGRPADVRHQRTSRRRPPATGQGDLFEPTWVQDHDGRAVELGARVELVDLFGRPRGIAGTLLEVYGRHRSPSGAVRWSVVVQPDGEGQPQHVLGDHQLRGVR